MVLDLTDSDGHPVDCEQVIGGYIRHAEAGPTDEAVFWAWDAVTRFIEHAPADEAWDLVVELLRRAPDAILGNIAAGPLEDLV